jgi:F0F1-type ATP synthase delta subunit
MHRCFSIAKEQNAIDEWQGYLRKIASMMSEPEFIGIVEHPGISFELKSGLAKEKLGKINPRL